MKERIVTVTAAQIEQTDNPDENLPKITEVISSTKSDLIIFPETSLTGLNKETDLTEHHRIIRGLARRTKTHLVYGYYEDNCNMARLVSDEGETLFTYQKQRLWNEPGVSSGFSNNVIETKIGNIGMLICWDLSHPELAKELAQAGAEIIVCPSYWFGKAYGTTNVISGMPLQRAFDAQSYLIYADAYTENGETAGRSKICSPLKVLAAAKPQKREIISTKIDLAKVPVWRSTFDNWKH